MVIQSHIRVSKTCSFTVYNHIVIICSGEVNMVGQLTELVSLLTELVGRLTELVGLSY